MAQPLKFAGSNAKFAPGAGTEDRVGHLECYRTPGGEVIARWRLSDAEKFQVAKTGDIWVSIMTFNHPLQPSMISGFPLMEARDEEGNPIPGYDPDTPFPMDLLPKPVYSFEKEPPADA